MSETKNESSDIWKKQLDGKMPTDWAKDIDGFETELHLKKQGKIEEKVFAESRLRYGAYGQRYDNGLRHDGKSQQKIPFPCGTMTKGPNTVWDAPGMERIKLPYGGMTPEQMDVLADLAEEYSDAICHVTTRQDIQLHYVHIEDTPSLFRRLAAVGITTKEACGNSVRNVTACPLAGVCHDQSFDVTPYADALFRYFLGHPDIQDFGRKFKIAFSGCSDHPCGLTSMHDMGAVAKTKVVNGKTIRGFEYYVGGGLGAVPQLAKLFDEFVPEEELMPLTQALFRIFARYGEKKNRNRARVKFLVRDWGIDKFREEVLKERALLKPDPRWNEFLKTLNHLDEKPAKEAGVRPAADASTPFGQWVKSNVYAQAQKGYNVVTVYLPLGDLTSNQMRDLASIVRKYTTGTARTTVEQNIVLRWIPDGDLQNLYNDLKKIDLAEPHAATIVDITACPGTDTCKLGTSASRGLAGELMTRLAEQQIIHNEAIRNLRIKVSGCFNSCSQHHIADMGFYGVGRKAGNHVVPHFQLVLGGQMQKNGGANGLAITTIPSKAIPATVTRLANMYLEGRSGDESFKSFIERTGKIAVKNALIDLAQIPSYEENKDYYVDWGNVREFTTSDIGVGECAGEVVSLTDMGLKVADREMFESQVVYEKGDLNKAVVAAYGAMLRAAQALVKSKNIDISENPEEIINEFNKYFCETGIFYDPFMGNQFAKYLFKAQEEGVDNISADRAHQRMEEAQLFIDAAHGCNIRMGMQQQAAQ
ncbi:nitrite/sulfite reductase [bacterium]|nr:nitrite/sulfite reductase [bacterium]